MHLTELSRFTGLVAKAKRKGLVLTESTDPNDGRKRFRLSDGNGILMVESSSITDAERAISEFLPIQPRQAPRSQKIKVYVWQGFRTPLSTTTRRVQSREIVAARSKAEVARIVGVKSPSALFCLGETKNQRAVAAAMAEPGTIFWRDIDASPEDPFIRVEPKPAMPPQEASMGITVYKPTVDDIKRGWIPMPDGVHAFITSARVKYDSTQGIFCEACGCFTIPITAITENADGSEPST